MSLFVKMHCRLPNFAMGSITSESIRDALMNGISAGQVQPILSFYVFILIYLFYFIYVILFTYVIFPV